ncbi:MAG: VOC family protein [Labilithrix sp.]|nr:VOC family protein [Labilithrix sp.]MCW5817630.1 VOC family protein [Labilithrix sp.]
MTTFTEHKQGTFSWIELATKDAAQAKKFYGELFGWSFEDMPAGPDLIYSMCNIGGKHVGALYQMGAEMAKEVPPHWDSYVTVNDVDATTKKVAPAGGKVVKEPFDVLDVGRMSVVQDPTGATLCLWQAKKHIGASIKDDPGTLCWNEVYTSNVDRAGKFYSEVLGWKLDPVDMGPMGVYTLFKAPGVEDSVGGMMGITKDMGDVPSHWCAYIATNDVDASAKKATDLGGTIMVPPTDIPNIGRFSIVSDPGGAMFALYKNMH